MRKKDGVNNGGVYSAFWKRGLEVELEIHDTVISNLPRIIVV